MSNSKRFLRLGSVLGGLLLAQAAFCLDFRELGAEPNCSRHIGERPETDRFVAYREALERRDPRAALAILAQAASYYQETASPLFVSNLLWGLSINAVVRSELTGSAIFETFVYEQLKIQQRLLLIQRQRSKDDVRVSMQIDDCLREIATRIAFRLSSGHALLFFKFFRTQLAPNFSPFQHGVLTEIEVRSAYNAYAETHFSTEDMGAAPSRETIGPILFIPRIETELWDDGAELVGHSSERNKRARRFISHLFLVYYDCLQHSSLGGANSERLRLWLPPKGMFESGNWETVYSRLNSPLDPTEETLLKLFFKDAKDGLRNSSVVSFQTHYPFTLWTPLPGAREFTLIQMAQSASITQAYKEIDDLPNPGMESTLVALFRESREHNHDRILSFFEKEIYIRPAIRDRLMAEALKVENYEAANLVATFNRHITRAQKPTSSSASGEEEIVPIRILAPPLNIPTSP